MKKINKRQIIKFQREILDFYRKNRRKMPWRGEKDPYKILISEVMLQQTQVSRVLTKYEYFLKEFPSFDSLAKATLKDVLRVWSGLGYNRRAKYLLEMARIIMRDYGGTLPRSVPELEGLPGLGKATARSVAAFIWNEPTIFIETNIRRVFIHSFFKEQIRVKDEDILRLILETLPKKNIRIWYYALMDYGAHLKVGENANRRSAHYKKQTKFKGSGREVRGFLVRVLSGSKGLSMAELSDAAPFSRTSLAQAMKGLKKEGIVSEVKDKFFIS